MREIELDPNDIYTTCTTEHVYVAGNITCICGKVKVPGLEVSKVIQQRLPDDYDPYGKDVAPLGSNREPTYRIKNGTLARLTDEELEDRDARRGRRHP